MAVQPPPISSLDGYEYDGVLGSGTSGVVIKYIKDGLPYAIKFIPDPTMQPYFQREIRILYQLNAYDLPIPKLYFAGRLTGSKIITSVPKDVQRLFVPMEHYVVLGMEYIQGIDLYQHSRKNFPLDDASIYNVAVWLFDTLRTLHELKMVHRDIKSDNIIITPDSRLYLVDFGFACSLTEKVNLCPVDQHGSAYYMAPELWDWDIHRDRYPATDVWAAGVVLYELLNNTVPWDITPEDEDRSYGDIRRLRNILGGRIVDLPPRPGKILSPISDVIDLAFDKNPLTRPTANDIYTILKSKPIL